MNTEKDKLAQALSEVASGSRRNKTAQLREIFDEVEAAKAAGASNKTIVDALAANGLIFDVNNFKNARSRILKERALAALTHASQAGVNTISRSALNTEPNHGDLSKKNERRKGNQSPNQRPRERETVPLLGKARLEKRALEKKPTAEDLKNLARRDIDLDEYENENE